MSVRASIFTTAFLLILPMAILACAPAPTPTPAPSPTPAPPAFTLTPTPGGAYAEIRNAAGEIIGAATFTQAPEGVKVVAEVAKLSAGRHGIHIHAVGDCSGQGFNATGAHFNPENKKHGLKNPDGPHAGDLPNLEVARDGTARLEYVNNRVTLGTGPNSLFDTDGSSLVIHAEPDDDMTDPAGKSGTLVACGVIKKS